MKKYFQEICAKPIKLVSLGALVSCITMGAQVYGDDTYSTRNGEWRTYGGNLESQRYSALSQINRENFSQLEKIWTFRPDNLGPIPEARLQATPLMVDGVLYLT